MAVLKLCLVGSGHDSDRCLFARGAIGTDNPDARQRSDETAWSDVAIEEDAIDTFAQTGALYHANPFGRCAVTPHDGKAVIDMDGIGRAANQEKCEGHKD